MVSVCVWKNTNKKGPITIPLTVHFLFNKITWLAAVKQCLVNNYYTITSCNISQHVELFTRLQGMPEYQCLILVVRNLLQAWCENEISIMLEYFYEECFIPSLISNSNLHGQQSSSSSPSGQSFSVSHHLLAIHVNPS